MGLYVQYRAIDMFNQFQNEESLSKNHCLINSIIMERVTLQKVIHFISNHLLLNYDLYVN